MRRHIRTISPFLLSVIGLVGVSGPVLAQPQAAGASGAKPAVQSAVADLIRRSTEVYQRMPTYQHTAEFVERGGQGGDLITAFRLALERPNKFSYRSDNLDLDAAVSDGRLFTNFKHDTTGAHFTRVTAPTDFKQINIVDDVTFTPIGTYLIALMLQGDPYADHDMRDFLQRASAPRTMLVEGVNYETITGPFGQEDKPIQVTLYFDARTHLLHKLSGEIAQSPIKITEVIESVKIDQPIPSSVFEYSPPKGALWLVHNNRPAQSKTLALRQ